MDLKSNVSFLINKLHAHLLLKGSLKNKSPSTQKTLLELQQRLTGFMTFLNKTTLVKEGKPAYLRQLPWYLLVGPGSAGKSSLLSESGVHFTLCKQPHHAMNTSETVDWWVTRNSCLIDVPGHYISSSTDGAILWRFLLRLIRCWRGNHGIKGLMIALPLPELIEEHHSAEYQALLTHLTDRIHAIQKIFSRPIPCQLIITKCDLIPGFTEFFTDASTEDLNHTWGIPLSTNQFDHRFDAFIKKLNDQLLTHLHHEYDPRAKSLIKEFPLRIESLRKHLADFIRPFDNTSCPISHIFLTSSLQPLQPVAANEYEIISTTERAIQLIHETKTPSHAYFTRQLVEQTIVKTASSKSTVYPAKPLHIYAIQLCGIALLSLAFVAIHRDFKQSNNYLQALNNTVAHHKLLIQQTVNPEDRLEQTLNLLIELQSAVSQRKHLYQWPLVSKLYTNDTQHKADFLYQEALSGLFIHELANYFTNYLTIPINKETENVYAALRAYLMLGNPNQMRPDVFITTLQRTLPPSFSSKQRAQIINYVSLALKQTWQPITLNQASIQATRHYLYSMPADKLAYIILENMADNNTKENIKLAETTRSIPVLINQQDTPIPTMFTAKAFPLVYKNEIQMAANEVAHGNWVLGEFTRSVTPEEISALTKRVETTYINNYIDLWETYLTNIHLMNASNLTEINLIVSQLISHHSPLLQLLQLLHTNTYFDPIASNSPKLYNIGLLLENNQNSQRQLYQLFLGLNNLQHYVAYVENAPDKNKAAFEVLAARMKNPNATNPIIQLKLIASNQPEPLKYWLDNIADETLRLLMQQANKYMDLSWQKQVSSVYQTYIANRYPFSSTAESDVDTNNFSLFFGNPGVVLNFYRDYLMPFVDTSKPEWRWKDIDGKSLPFSNDALHAIQLAMRIHHTFFPNDDNKLAIQFTLQPYKVDTIFQQIKLSINDNVFINNASNAKQSHLFSWPENNRINQTVIQLSMPGNKVIQQSYSGAWGWFKLVNQSYDVMLNKKEIVINLSKNKDAAKYIIHVNSASNPFLSLNLHYFHLPEHLN